MPRIRPAIRITAIAFAAGLAASLVIAAPAQAASDITVTSSADSGAGSLRDALASAVSGDRILFAPAVTSIELLTALVVPGGVQIDGPGSNALTISRVAAGNFNQLQFTDGGEDYVVDGLTLDGTGSQAPALYAAFVDDVTLRDIVVKDQTSAIGGAALYTFQTSGDFLIEDSRFESNDGTGIGPGADGGALRLDDVAGTLTIRNSVFVGNRSALSGGAGWIGGVAGNIEISDSTFEGNTATAGPGGALRFSALGDAASTLIESSSFLDNTAGTGFSFGGALFGGFPALTVLSTTFAGNTLPGGGIGLSFGGEVYGPALIQNSTFDETGDDEFALYFSGLDTGPVTPSVDLLNSTIVAPAGLYIENNEGTALIENSIVQATNGRAVATDSGADVLVRWSILSTALDADIIDGGNNLFSTNALLGPLANNGGPTLTRMPLAASPAINRGDPSVVGAPAFDQRGAGFPRILQGRLDVGAVETAVLASTGQPLPWSLPVVGGVLLLGGIGAIVFVGIQRRKGVAAA